MRWFKHLSLAAEDEKLAEVLEVFGAEGYGVYWIILEKIAFLMDGTDKTSARYSVKKWSKFCGKSPKVFRKFLESFEKLLLFRVEICQNNSDFLIIDCPNLLKYRDEYTKKSGQTPDNIPEVSGQTPDQDRETETETETELETDTETEENIPQNEFAEHNQKGFYLTKKKRKLQGKRLITFNRFWESFNYKKDRASAADSWIDIPELTDVLVNQICEAAKIEAENRSTAISKGMTPKFAQGWLTARRWEDEQIKYQDDDGMLKAQREIERTQKYLNE